MMASINSNMTSPFDLFPPIINTISSSSLRINISSKVQNPPTRVFINHRGVLEFNNNGYSKGKWKMERGTCGGEELSAERKGRAYKREWWGTVAFHLKLRMSDTKRHATLTTLSTNRIKCSSFFFATDTCSNEFADMPKKQNNLFLFSRFFFSIFKPYSFSSVPTQMPLIINLPNKVQFTPNALSKFGTLAVAHSYITLPLQTHLSLAPIFLNQNSFLFFFFFYFSK